MNLQCRVDLGRPYRAGSQIARVLTEEWCAREMYCAACSSDRLSSQKANTPAHDLVCPRCNQRLQLKGFKAWGQGKIVDAGYVAMIRAIQSDSVPNLLVLQYSTDWMVRNLILVPSVFFSESIIEKRPPLGPTARRAGWIGCNVLLGRIPPDGRIPVVAAGSVVPVREVRSEFSRVRSWLRCRRLSGAGRSMSSAQYESWERPVSHCRSYISLNLCSAVFTRGTRTYGRKSDSSFRFFGT